MLHKKCDLQQIIKLRQTHFVIVSKRQKTHYFANLITDFLLLYKCISFLMRNIKIHKAKIIISTAQRDSKEAEIHQTYLKMDCNYSIIHSGEE